MPGGDSLATIPLAYLTVYLGLLDPPRIRILFGGDYSYGIFLYGFPVQQAIASLGPWAQHWFVSLGLGLPLTVVVAVISWRLIEQPVLRRRGLLIAVEDKYLGALAFAGERFARRQRA